MKEINEIEDDNHEVQIKARSSTVILISTPSSRTLQNKKELFIVIRDPLKKTRHSYKK
jgi:hypothetical protein